MNTRTQLAISLFLLAAAFLPLAATPEAEPPSRTFELMDIFNLEYAADPQFSPDGQRIVYVRTFMDLMSDRRRTNLWLLKADGSDHRPLTSGNRNDFSPRWSPDGARLLYASGIDGSVQLYLRWMDTGQTAKLSQLTRAPSSLSWSPDGRWIAFTMLVPEKEKPLARLPAPPEGAEWAQRPRVIRRLLYRADGAGYLESGHQQLFLLPAEGGTPRQVTSGPYNVNSPNWTPDGRHIIFSSNRRQDWEYDLLNSEVYALSLADDSVRALTDRQGPDNSPRVSPDGRLIAYLGFDDRRQGYQVTHLYLMNPDGSDNRLLAGDFDRDIRNLQWSADSHGLFFQYDDEGNTKLAFVSLAGEVKKLADDVGGLSLGRPYSGGDFSVAANGLIAFTLGRPGHPADIAVVESGGGEVRRLTRLNDDLFAFKKLGAVEEIWWESSYDGRRIQGWIVKPPDFDPAKKYPLILEIHGGPFANYGDRFSAEIQLYAAAGYVVLYANPRGSTSYGEEFGNLIHHNYPGQDYDDLMSGVDAVLALGYVDPENLFVTGGSGGGVLTSWIVGKTDRFRAAVVAKPVINWYSFALTSDGYPFFYRYWFPGFPWEYTNHYMQRSPISLVGNVTTPTMLLTGEQDYRTPMSESEQFYQALKLRRVDTALVRIQEASHGIARRPSNLINKVAYILAWFENYRTDKAEEEGAN
ncbi:MAG: prolyl oligopeptidase family serine peptidase [Terriglobia bacterium]